jgi:CRISPR-associated protein Cmr1
VEKYVRQERWRKPEPKAKDADFAWASLENFWCVNGKYLARQDANSSSFNTVIGRPEHKQQSSQNDSWIAGRRPNREKEIEPESKKVFSFKDPARTFGFVEKADSEHWNKIKNSLMNLKNVVAQWNDFNLEKQLLTKNQILVKLFNGEGRV